MKNQPPVIDILLGTLEPGTTVAFSHHESGILSCTITAQTGGIAYLEVTHLIEHNIRTVLTKARDDMRQKSRP